MCFLKPRRPCADFRSEYRIPFHKCSSPTDALKEAFKLGAYLTENEPAAYPSVVVRHFLALIQKPVGLPRDLPQMFDELWKAFEIRQGSFPEREPPDVTTT